jgi:HPt (histidine-containing phosphotransfer) domain-containing protein
MTYSPMTSPDDPTAAEGGRVLDEFAFVDIVDGDMEFAADLLETFEVMSGERIAAVEHAASEHDVESVRRSAHALKGVSRQLGGVRLGDLCERIEALAHAGELDEVRRSARALSTEADALRRALERCIERHKASAA